MRLSSCVLRMLLCGQILAYQMFYISPNNDVMLIMTTPHMIALSPDLLREPGDEAIQWNLYNPDTFGPGKSVLIMEVS